MELCSGFYRWSDERFVCENVLLIVGNVRKEFGYFDFLFAQLQGVNDDYWQIDPAKFISVLIKIHL